MTDLGLVAPVTAFGTQSLTLTSQQGSLCINPHISIVKIASALQGLSQGWAGGQDAGGGREEEESS